MSCEVNTTNNNDVSTSQAVAALMALAGQCDAGAEDHGKRVAVYSKVLGQRMGLSDSDLKNLVNAAALHDIGKITISQSILNKMGRLTVEEFEIMKIHSTVALNVLAKVDSLRPASSLIKHHHERYDGKGYPEGLVGDSIPLGARIISVAETFDILVSGAPWKEKCSVNDAFNEIVRCSGTQFDPQVVEALRASIGNQELSI